MLQIDDSGCTKTSMAGAKEKTATAFDSWKSISSKSKNIVVRCTFCAGNKTFSTTNISTLSLFKYLTGQHSPSTHKREWSLFLTTGATWV